MLHMPMIFGNGMVLQRQKEIAVWGTAEAGTEVTVTLSDAREEAAGEAGLQKIEEFSRETGFEKVEGSSEEAAVQNAEEASREVLLRKSELEAGRKRYGTGQAHTRADGQGVWRVTLPAGEAGRGLWMKVEAGREQLVYSDISIGEVWIAGGQSNMEYLLKYDADKELELARDANPDIRFFDYPEVSYEGQIEEFPEPDYGFWRQAEARQLPWFSAIGYYFARILYRKLDVPIGIVGCNWGGTPACAWQDTEGLRGTEGEAWLIDYAKATADLDMEAYWRKVKENLAQMKKTQNQVEQAEELEQIREVGQARETELDREAGQLEMAAVWERVMYPGLSRGEQLQMMQQMEKMTADTADKIDGEAAKIDMMKLQPQNRPGGLYQTMLQKVAPFTARGVIWYQGESDETHAEAYATVFGRMIADWRALWQEELPFLFVQLAPFGQWLGGTGVEYPELRKQQERVSQEVAHTWMASIGDAGMLDDIHPKHKRPVGERLAELALGHVYERPELCRVPGLCDAPEFERAERVPTTYSESTYQRREGIGESYPKETGIANTGQEEIRIYFRYGEGLHLETHGYTTAEPDIGYLRQEEQKQEKQKQEELGEWSVGQGQPKVQAVLVPALRLYQAVCGSDLQKSVPQKLQEGQLACERLSGEKAEIPVEEIQIQGNSLVLFGSFPEQVEICFAWEPYYEVNVYNAAGIPVKPFRIRV